MTMMADQVDFVIGVDTHKNTNPATVVVATTGEMLEDRTVPSTLEGHGSLFEMAERFPGRRLWAIDGAGSYGAGLTRFLAQRGERVVELDRPSRARRRGGHKTDSIDAVRSAREAISRPDLGEPRSTGARAALAMLLAARRSAVDAYSDARRQLHGLIVSAPESLRSRFRDVTTTEMSHRATRIRLNPNWDLETRTTAGVLRDLARRVLELERQARGHER
jgi:transposase